MGKKAKALRSLELAHNHSHCVSKDGWEGLFSHSCLQFIDLRANGLTDLDIATMCAPRRGAYSPSRSKSPKGRYSRLEPLEPLSQGTLIFSQRPKVTLTFTP